MTSTTWSLCLVSAPGNNRKVVKVDPTKDSVGDLFRIASQAFGGDASVQSLKIGFPPQALDSGDTTLLSESKKVGNQERVQVILNDK